MQRLTAKQRAFVDCFIVHRNATRAAREAGYSEASVRQIGSENLSKPYILAAIDSRLNELTLSANEVLKRLTDHAMGDIGDFLDVTSMGYTIDLKKAKEAKKTHLIKKIKQTVTTITQPDGIEKETIYTELELHDSQSALVWIGKHYKLFSDRLVIDTEWETAQNDLVELIRTDQVGYDELKSDFNDELLQDLFSKAGKTIDA